MTVFPACGPSSSACQHPPHVRVGEVDAGQIGRHGAPPLPRRGHQLVVLQTALRGRGLRHVVEVVREIRRQLDLGLGELVEVLLRRVERQVRAIEAAGQEEGPRVISRQVLGRPVGELGVGRLFVVDVERAPVEAAAVELVQGVAGGPQKAAEAVVVVPRGGFVLALVKRLAAADRFVAVLHEVLRQGDGQWHGVAPDVPVVVAAGGGGAPAGHQTRPGGVAGGGLAVGPPERDAAPGERVDVRRERLRVTVEDADPVVQIVDRDDEDIRAGAARLSTARATRGQGAEPQAPEQLASREHFAQGAPIPPTEISPVSFVGSYSGFGVGNSRSTLAR